MRVAANPYDVLALNREIAMKIRRFFLCLALLGTAATMNACMDFSSSRESLDLEQQVQQQNAQLRQLQPAQADMQNEVQALRVEINSLRGQIDDLQNAGGARAIVDRVNRQDAALRQIDDRMALNLDLGVPSAPTTSTTVNPAVNTPDFTTNAPYGNPAAGTLPYQGAAVQQPQAKQNFLQAQAPPSGSTWGQPSPKPATAPAPQKDISLALFDAGINAYNVRKYNEAQQSFSDFLKNYPSHNLVSEAQFYLAECHFQRNRFSDAALAYDTVIKKYPSSSSTPGSYLKQGICFSKLNQKAAANARMHELIKKFPKSPEAARAKSFLQTNK